MQQKTVLRPSGNAWRRKAGLATVESETRAVIFDLDRLADPPMILEGPAAVIWTALDSEIAKDAKDLVDQVSRVVGLSPADIEPDVSRFLDDLALKGLVVPLRTNP